MSWFLRLRVLIAIALGGLFVGGCSSDGSDAPEPEAAPSVSATPSTAGSPSETPSAAPADAKCQVKGYVPGHTVTAGPGSKPVVVVAQGLRGNPGSMVTMSDPTAEDFAAPGVSATSAGVTIDPADEKAILGTFAGPVDPDPASIDLNLTYGERRGRFVAYRVATLIDGTFAIRACGAPYNDGTSEEKVDGTFHALEEPGKTLVVYCGDEPANKAAQRAQALGCGA